MEGLEERNDTFYVCDCAIFFFGFDFQIIGTNL